MSQSLRAHLFSRAHLILQKSDIHFFFGLNFFFPIFFTQIIKQTREYGPTLWKNLCFDKLTIGEDQTATVKAFVHDHDDSTSKDEVAT